MGTTVIEKEDPPLAERVPIRTRLLLLAAVVAIAASFAAQPFAAIAGGALVVLAGEIGRRVR